VSNEAAARKWQNAIIGDCELILRRELTFEEAEFIRARGGFMALEMIQDYVRGMKGKPAELQAYLRSESDD